MEQQNFFTAPQPMQPLAARLRPQSLEEFVGQRHSAGSGKGASAADRGRPYLLHDLLGPARRGQDHAGPHHRQPDQGAVHRLFRRHQRHQGDPRGDGRGGGTTPLYGEKTIVFVDEIHRFNKAQQDAFLPFVEKGSIVLIGATTENPSFEVNGGASLPVQGVRAARPDHGRPDAACCERALKDPRGFGGQKVDMAPELLRAMADFANGDARTALSTLEMVVLNGDLDGDTHHRHRRDAGAVHLQKIPFV